MLRPLVQIWALLVAVGGGVVVAADPFPGLLPGVEIGDGLPSGYEPSGAVWHDRLAGLLVVSDGGTLSLLSADGTEVTNWNVPGDLEAVTVADPDSNLIYIGVEHPDSVLEFDLSSGQLLRTFDLTGTLKGPSSRGLEALTFRPLAGNPEGGLFYAGLQNDGRIYVFELPIVTSSSSTATLHVTTLTPAAERDDISAMDWDEQHQTLYAAFDGDDLLRAMTADTTLIDEWELPGGQQEGIALTPCALWVSEDNSAEVWRYDFPTDALDQDTDGVLDCLDNCPVAVNPGQADDDGDAAGDVCDCAPFDASASSGPLEVRELIVAYSPSPPETHLSWTPEDVVYDLASGLLAELQIDTGSSGAQCLQDDLVAAMSLDLRPDPLSGAGYYYLVRGDNVCGVGPYGFESSGAPREPLSACP